MTKPSFVTPPFSSVWPPFRRPGIDGIEGIAGIAGIETVGIEGIAGIDGMDAFPSQPVTLDDTPEKTPPFVGLEGIEGNGREKSECTD